MKKDSARVAKDDSRPRNSGITGKSSLKSSSPEDKRKTARHEHTNHFTNRAPQEKK